MSWFICYICVPCECTNLICNIIGTNLICNIIARMNISDIHRLPHMVIIYLEKKYAKLNLIYFWKPTYFVINMKLINSLIPYILVNEKLRIRIIPTLFLTTNLVYYMQRRPFGYVSGATYRTRLLILIFIRVPTTYLWNKKKKLYICDSCCLSYNLLVARL